MSVRGYWWMAFALAFMSLSLRGEHDESAVASFQSPPQEKPVQETDEKVLRERLVGTWKIVSATLNGKPSELHKKSITLKLITPTNMIWIGYQPEDRRIFRSAGGSWTIKEGRYVETMRYGLDEKFKSNSFGKSLGFDCRFEGDRWIQSGKIGDVFSRGNMATCSA